MTDTYLLNMGFSNIACSLAKDQHWIKSSANGVSSIHLECEAAESGHTTSFVKFEVGSYFHLLMTPEINDG